MSELANSAVYRKLNSLLWAYLKWWWELWDL